MQSAVETIAKTPKTKKVVETSAVVKKEKKKRNVNPDKMTYIKAFAIWKSQQNPPYVGLSPKRGSEQYNQIMKIMKGEK